MEVLRDGSSRVRPELELEQILARLPRSNVGVLRDGLSWVRPELRIQYQNFSCGGRAARGLQIVPKQRLRN